MLMRDLPVLPDVLTDAGFSLGSHIFRFRADRDMHLNHGGESKVVSICTNEIESKSIWHSAIGALNDPFEIYAKKNSREFDEMSLQQRIKLWLKLTSRYGTGGVFALSKEALEAAYYENEQRVINTLKDIDNLDNTFDEFITEIRESIAIACFTNVCDSRLMWGYYCNGLSGVCLIYNKTQLLKNNVELNPVSYINGAFELNVLDFTFNYKEQLRAKTLSQIVKTKHKEWEHENEYRSVVDLSEDESGKGKLICLETDCLDGVIIGKRVRDSVKAQIRKLAKRYKFKVFMADVDYQLFSVKIYK